MAVGTMGEWGLQDRAAVQRCVALLRPLVQGLTEVLAWEQGLSPLHSPCIVWFDQGRDGFSL